LTGLLRCPICGPAQRCQGTTLKHCAPRYRCAPASGSKAGLGCNYTIKADVADAAVLARIAPLCTNAEDRLRRELHRTHADHQAEPADDRSATIARLTTIRDNAKAELAELTRQFSRKELSELRYS